MERENKTLKTTYFSHPGSDNTDETLKLAYQRAKELEINTILVASTGGETGIKAVKLFGGCKVVVVSHCYGMRAPDEQEMEPEKKALIESSGGMVLTTTHAFAGISRAIRKKLNTYQSTEIMAHTLRIFGEGMKVVCEIAVMAADAGLVKTSEEVIAIGGSGRGADTAVVLKPAHAHDFFDLRIKEIICKPRLD